jgi:hypothetical protein
MHMDHYSNSLNKIIESDFIVHTLPSPPLSDTGISEDDNQPISDDGDRVSASEIINEGEDKYKEIAKTHQYSFSDIPKELRIRILQLLTVTDLMKAAMVISLTIKIIVKMIQALILLYI